MSGKSGIRYIYIIRNNGASLEIYIDKGDFEKNKGIFDELKKYKSEIENAFGNSLVWDRLDENRASVIRYPVSDFGLINEDRWPEIQDQMIDAMIRLEKAFQPYILKLD